VFVLFGAYCLACIAAGDWFYVLKFSD